MPGYLNFMEAAVCGCVSAKGWRENQHFSSSQEKTCLDFSADFGQAVSSLN